LTPRQQLDSFIARYAPEVAALTRAAFAWMRRKFPGATVMVYDNYNALAIGFGPGDRVSDAVFSIAAYPRWANLFFLQGASLPDPQKRLQGGGKQVRSVRIETMALFEEPAILKLLDLAAEPSMRSRRPGGGKILIKSVSAKQRPRRAGSEH